MLSRRVSKCENLGVVQPFEEHNLILKVKIGKRKHPPEDEAEDIYVNRGRKKKAKVLNSRRKTNSKLGKAKKAAQN